MAAGQGPQIGTQPFQAIYWKDALVPLHAQQQSGRTQESSVECAASPLALSGISRGHFAVTKLSTRAYGLWVGPGMPGAKNESQSELSGKNVMGWALGTRFIVGRGTVLRGSLWDPWNSWDLSHPVLLGPEMQPLAQKRVYAPCFWGGASGLSCIPQILIEGLLCVSHPATP